MAGRRMRAWAWAAAAVSALATGRAEGGYIVETATLGANPTSAIGISSAQYVGTRFSISQQVQVDGIGLDVTGFDKQSFSVFGAIVPLSGPGGLPTGTPGDLSTYALAGTSLPVTSSSPVDVSAPLSVLLQPGDYGLVFGVGPYGSTGAANLTGGNVPTSGATFFSGLTIGGGGWSDEPGYSGLRMFLTGTPVAITPEPSGLASVAAGGAVLAAFAVGRTLARATAAL